MKLSNEWYDYECISAGNGEKLERWGNVILRRPDPQAMWLVAYNDTWKNPDAFSLHPVPDHIPAAGTRSAELHSAWFCRNRPLR